MLPAEQRAERAAQIAHSIEQEGVHDDDLHEIRILIRHEDESRRKQLDFRKRELEKEKPKESRLKAISTAINNSDDVITKLHNASVCIENNDIGAAIAELRYASLVREKKDIPNVGYTQTAKLYKKFEKYEEQARMREKFKNPRFQEWLRAGGWNSTLAWLEDELANDVQQDNLESSAERSAE